MSLEIKTSPSFVPSVFPRRKRSAEETDAQGTTFQLPHLCSIPEYVKLVYGVNKVEGIEKEFNFLNRDNVEKSYVPNKEDPFVFKDQASLHLFKSEAHSLIDWLTNKWSSLNLPTIRDKERDINIPDTAGVVNSLLSEDPSKSKAINHFLEVRYEAVNIGSNIDIMKKAALVRSVSHGWWVVSYRGKNTPHLDHFSPALRVLNATFSHLRNSPRFKILLEETINSQGDPLDTNVGYPYFTAEVDEWGNPIGRLKTINLFKGIGTQGHDYDKVISEVGSRVPDGVMSRYPFAISSIRRQQPGYKWNHVWKSTSLGLKIDRDERGNTTNRVAFNASYIQNQMLSPVQSEWKTFRKLIPGIFFDGNTKTEVLNVIRSSKSIVFESDFSNYDRSIPNNLASAIFAMYARLTKHPDYYYKLLKGTHQHLPLIWPDWIPGKRGTGWIFWVDELALLSGLKITAEVGTLVNLVVIMQSILDAKLMDEKQLFTYLTRNSITRSTNQDVLFLIQSDDTMFCHKDLKVLQRLTNSFISNANEAGLKGSLELGDRFLMRHMTDGVDRPLASRIWQNTLSNESGYQDPLKFMVGMVARTDGLFGLKSVDPFATGRIQTISTTEQEFSIKVIESLLRFTKTAAHPVEPVNQFLNLMLTHARQFSKSSNGYKGNDSALNEITALRNRFISLLADQELLVAAKKDKLYETFLYQLHKNALSPTTAQVLEAMIKSSPLMAKLLNQIESKEHNFYVNSMKELNIPLSID